METRTASLKRLGVSLSAAPCVVPLFLQGEGGTLEAPAQDLSPGRRGSKSIAVCAVLKDGIEKLD